jgi:AraC family transcriptional regulator
MKHSEKISFGSVLFSTSAADFIVTETQHPAGSSLDFHDHEAPNLNFVLAGFHTERFRSREFPCGRGSIVVKPSGAVHANTYSDSGSHAFIFEFPHAKETDQKWSQLFSEIRWLDCGMPSSYAWRAVAEAKTKAPGWKIRVEELMLLLSAHMSRRGGTQREHSLSWFSDLREYLEANYQYDLTVADVASLFGVHPVYLTRAFRKRFGMTVAQFIRWKRIDRAVREISLKSKNLAQIALECGFYDQSHLTNQFRSFLGISPGTLRNLSDRFNSYKTP